MRKIRMGMVGGGRGAFIGAVHRMAAALDGQIELVCGAFSSNPENSAASGADFYLDPKRVYANYEEMILAEAKLPAYIRMDFVSIVTPNHVHFEPARMALENGFHVVCDKPLCFDMEQAKTLQNLVHRTGLTFALTHNYTGYPMVKQAKAMIANGALGKVRRIIVEYPQGWLSSYLEGSNQKQAAWRTDPKRSGMVGAMGDIGTHAENLAEYISGLTIKRLYANLNIIVEGRLLDDDGTILIEYDNGARGTLFASQICAGEENNLNIRIYGELGGLEWRQMEPNSLVLKWADRPKEIWRTGVGAHAEASTAHTRIPAGHPEGYLEAFANIYRNFAANLQAKLAGQAPNPLLDFPSIDDGVRGMEFIYNIIESNTKNAWIEVE